MCVCALLLWSLILAAADVCVCVCVCVCAIFACIGESPDPDKMYTSGTCV